MAEKKPYTPAQREAYSKAFKDAGKTPAGSKDALFGGNVRHAAGKKAAQEKK